MVAAIERALAPDPADRFLTGGALAAALDPMAAGTSRPPTRSVARWVGVTTLLVAGLMVTRFFTTNARAAVLAKDYVLLAGVSADSADREAGAALRSVLELGLQESPHVNLVPPSVVSRTGTMMNLPPTTPVVDSVAREIAIRVGAKAVIEPRLRRDGDRYHLTVAIRAPGSNRTFVERRAEAVGIDSLLTTMTALVTRLRRDLGERLTDAEPVARLDYVTTPSLDALQRFTEGMRAFRAAKYPTAIAAFTEAVALDSNFAMARKALGVSLYWVGDPQAGDREFDRALALIDRLTERERLLMTADIDNWRGHADRAITGYGRVLERYPNDLDTRRVRAYALFRGGRPNEAIDEYRTLLAVDSLDASSQINLAASLASQGTFREALPHYATRFRLNPNNYRTGSLVHEYAFSYWEAGFADSARALARQVADRNRPAKATAARIEALLDLVDGNLAAAARGFRVAALGFAESRSHQSMLRTLLHLARTNGWLGRPAEARTALRQALAVDPSGRTEWLMASGARIAAELDDRGTMREFAGLVRTLADTSRPAPRSEFFLTAALAALADGRNAEAVTAAERANAVRSWARTQAMLARALRAGGDTAGALRTYDLLLAQRIGGGQEEHFDQLAAYLPSAELLLARGDSAAARARLTALLKRWQQADSTNPLKRDAARRLAALSR